MPSLDEKKPLAVIACSVLQDMLETLLPENMKEGVSYMDYGLHRFPSKMTQTLQDRIDGLKEPGLVLLGYGLCGNGLAGIRAGRHVLLIPRVDDCISLLLGSYEAYMREFEREPGTYYLSKGWLESGSHPLKEYEEYKTQYGSEETDWIMDQQYRNYKRLVFVAQARDDFKTYRPQALAVARYCARWDMRYEEILGSDHYVRRMIEAAASPERADDDFVVIPPGGQIRQELFIRQHMADLDFGT